MCLAQILTLVVDANLRTLESLSKYPFSTHNLYKANKAYLGLWMEKAQEQKQCFRKNLVIIFLLTQVYSTDFEYHFHFPQYFYPVPPLAPQFFSHGKTKDLGWNPNLKLWLLGFLRNCHRLRLKDQANFHKDLI
jgi:hypothetical protein